MVVKQDDNPKFCWVKKFEQQCRGKNYKVKLSDIVLAANQHEKMSLSVMMTGLKNQVKNFHLVRLKNLVRTPFLSSSDL